MWEELRLEQPDITLRKARFEDWESLLRNIWSRPETARFMLWEPTFTEEEAKDRIRRTIAFEQKEKYGLIVSEKVSGQAIGWAGMKEIKPGVFEEMGIALGPDFTGKGYGRQALAALLKEAFEVCGAEKFLYSWWEENEISCRLQKSFGFAFSGKEERADPRNGAAYVMNHSVLTREQYFSR